MTYITVQDIKDLLPESILIELTYDGEGERSVDDTKIEKAISWAEAVVDSYLCKRYTVPLTGTIPELVKECATDFAIYRLYARVEKEETAKDKKEVAEKLLQNIAEGKADLPIGGTEGDVRYKSRDKVFTEERLDESDS